MQIAFVAGRLAYRTDGAWVDVPRLVAAEVRFLRKTRRTPSNAHVSIDCYRQNAVFVEPGGFHWCEVTGPKRYPKRLVIVGMDAEGHYDAFFSNFSQAAYGN
jgi:hypothetical protein